MAWSSDARRPETDLARIGLGVRYELRDCFGWNRRIYHHDEREADELRKVTRHLSFNRPIRPAIRMEFSVHTGQRNAENASCSVSYIFIKLLKPLVSRTSITGPLALQILSSPRFPCNNLAPRRITRRPALLKYSSPARLRRTRLCSPFAIFTMRSPASPDEVLSRLPLMSTTSTSWILRVSIFIGAS